MTTLAIADLQAWMKTSSAKLPAKAAKPVAGISKMTPHAQAQPVKKEPLHSQPKQNDKVEKTATNRWAY
jgi:hypothetical protein